MSRIFHNNKYLCLHAITKPFGIIFPAYLATLLIFQKKLDHILPVFWQKVLLITLLLSFIAFISGIIIRSIESYKYGKGGFFEVKAKRFRKIKTIKK
jgi:hypothetical protein